MNRHARIRLTASAALIALSWAPAALGEDCARAAGPGDARVEVAASLQRRFPELPGQIRAALEARSDLERCARVGLSLRASLITVDVTLADGRATSRSVQQQRDVLPIIEALLLVPEGAINAVESDSSEPLVEHASMNSEPRASAERAKAPPTNVERVKAPPARGTAPRWSRRFELGTPAPAVDPNAEHFALEFSAVGGARIGLDRTSVGLGVLSLADLWGWLVAFEGRAISYSAEQEPGSLTVLQLSALTGRRFRFASMALDLLAGPAVALRDASTVQPPSEHRGSASGVVPRVVLASHLSFAERSPVRGFVGLEGEFGPGGPQTQNDTARLPAWMAGIALGATVGTR